MLVNAALRDESETTARCGSAAGRRGTTYCTGQYIQYREQKERYSDRGRHDAHATRRQRSCDTITRRLLIIANIGGPSGVMLQACIAPSRCHVPPNLCTSDSGVLSPPRRPSAGWKILATFATNTMISGNDSLLQCSPRHGSCGEI
ncbi:hypothetical protein EVAR_80607_1 [Eumeta japonica]|uniref:Uncharacterized protein n=1 Tax=Eumeta variegata TaxID=151549 RepID=A0A4C1TNR5_EUMVA|nr:hypothetical protein EVAR_80607_1 [Eumeta japonica]